MGVGFTVGEKHAAGGAGDDLVAVEGDGVEIAEGAGLAALVGRAQRLRRVLHHERAVLCADGPERVDLPGGAVEMGGHHQFDLGIQLEGLLQGNGVHIPGVSLGVDEDGLAPLIGDGVDGGVKGHVTGKDLFPLQRAVARAGLAVEPLTRELHRKVQGRRAAGEGDGVPTAQLFAGQTLHLVDVGAHGAHPVGVEGLPHILQLLPVHGGGGQVDLLFKGLDFHSGDLL